MIISHKRQVFDKVDNLYFYVYCFYKVVLFKEPPLLQKRIKKFFSPYFHTVNNNNITKFSLS